MPQGLAGMAIAANGKAHAGFSESTAGPLGGQQAAETKRQGEAATASMHEGKS